MPDFRQLELFLDSTYAANEQRRFIFKSRCVCNYLERGLVSLNFRTKLARLNIHCSTEPKAVRVRPLKIEPFLEVCINYDLPPIDSLNTIALQRHYFGVILKGLEAAETYMPVPIDHCRAALAEFENGGFLNRWVYLDKQWDRLGCRCLLTAELTIDKFLLEQLVYVNGCVVASKQVVETKPREMLFHEYLGMLSIQGGNRLVYKSKSKVLSIFDLEHGTFLDV